MVPVPVVLARFELWMTYRVLFKASYVECMCYLSDASPVWRGSTGTRAMSQRVGMTL